MLRHAHGAEFMLLFFYTRYRVPGSELLAASDGTRLLTRINTTQLTKSTTPPPNLYVYTAEILVLQENLFLYRTQKGVSELVSSAILHCTCQNMKFPPPYHKSARIHLINTKTRPFLTVSMVEKFNVHKHFQQLWLKM